MKLTDQARTVFFISDRTGITAETLGLSLLSQFETFHFKQLSMPFVDSVYKAKQVVTKINQAYQQDHAKPIVFATLIDQDVKAMLNDSPALVIDYFDTFIGQIEQELNASSSRVVGKSHAVQDEAAYDDRMEAVNFALNYDDGAKTHYQKADIILVGVSRSGKTPTCLYLAMHYGIYAANYPITPEDMARNQLPASLMQEKNKLFGLTIDPKRLAQIREGRRPMSEYAAYDNCQQEVKTAFKLMKQLDIPYLDSTNVSIEELATRIMVMAKLQPNVL